MENNPDLHWKQKRGSCESYKSDGVNRTVGSRETLKLEVNLPYELRADATLGKSLLVVISTPNGVRDCFGYVF
jgi:hypothetical protein